MDDPIHLLTFARVVEARSFARGAQRLGLTASVASKHVAKLEHSLGARLLNRSTRRLSLTEAGAACYAHCARLCEQLEAAEQALAATREQPEGLLRISAPPALISLHVAPALAAFRERYPKLDLEFDLSGRVVDFEVEDYDLALRVTEAPAADLQACVLAPLRIGLVAAPDYLRRRGTPRVPEDLAGHDGLLSSLDPDPDVWELVSDARQARVPVHGALRCDVFEPLHRMALQGLGIGRLPTFMTRTDVREQRLRVVLPEWRQATRARLWAVWPQRRHGNRRVQVFVDFLQARFEREPAERSGSRSVR